MKIAVLTDSHDNHPLIEKANLSLKEKSCERIIFCGDIGSPTALIRLAESGLPIDMVFGNNDGERFGMLKAALKYKEVIIHGEMAELEIEKRKIFLTHYPLYAHHAAAAGKYDAVFYGHLHGQAQVANAGKTLLAHPGTLMSLQAPMSYGVYNTENNSIEIVKLAEAIVV